MKRSILLLCATAAIAYSRPGETSGQIEKRFGRPLGHFQLMGFDEPNERPESAPPLTSSLRETSRTYRFNAVQITVFYFDNKSQREEYQKLVDGKVERARIVSQMTDSQRELYFKNYIEPVSPLQKDLMTSKLSDEEGAIILKAASNNAPWQKQDDGSLKSNGLKAWSEGDRLIVETDAFEKFRPSQPSNKVTPATPIPGQGKGF